MGPFTVDLSGRVALITDGGGGIGRAAALALAKSGAAVCVNALNPDRADRVVDAIIAAGGQAMPWTADVSNRFQAAALIEAVREQFGALHIIINSAQVNKRDPLLHLDEYDWRRTLEINLTGAFFCTQLAGRVMAEEGGGVIVNVIGTTSTVEGEAAAFSASQAALRDLTHTAAHTLAAHGIRVNAINTRTETSVPDDKSTLDAAAGAILFLCSDAAALVHGQTLTLCAPEG